MIEIPIPVRGCGTGWSLFKGHHAVTQPAQMSALELQLGVLEAMRRFYSWPAIRASSLAGALRRLPDRVRASRPALLRQLLMMARAAWARRWEDVAPLLHVALPAPLQARIAGALWLPALRFSARRQIAARLEQVRSHSHLAFLASR